MPAQLLNNIQCETCSRVNQISPLFSALNTPCQFCGNVLMFSRASGHQMSGSDGEDEGEESDDDKPHLPYELISINSILGQLERLPRKELDASSMNLLQHNIREYYRDYTSNTAGANFSFDGTPAQIQQLIGEFQNERRSSQNLVKKIIVKWLENSEQTIRQVGRKNFGELQDYINEYYQNFGIPRKIQITPENIRPLIAEFQAREFVQVVRRRAQSQRPPSPPFPPHRPHSPFGSSSSFSSSSSSSSSSSAFARPSSPSQQAPAFWICQTCTLQNELANRDCAACGLPRVHSPQRPPSPQFVHPPTDPLATLLPKPGDEIREGWEVWNLGSTRLPQVPLQPWNCECGMQNAPDAFQCEQCGRMPEL
jgi:hypothetical protein